MSSASHTNWPQGAVRLVATGIGATVAGPLGASLGGMPGGIVSEQAANLIGDNVVKMGRTELRFARVQEYVPRKKLGRKDRRDISDQDLRE